ncbi:aldehyde dehydrogenase family protein, partial [Actinoplanes sp. NPDC049596]|uniref:aldehyde dehydrogenase family protein n=1 Tax=Actinoplanes sp. NPDC049596 TaxID=3154625 RepID=UPI0034414871
MYDVEQHIAGRWEPGNSDRRLSVVNPADGTPVTTVPVSSETDVAAAVAAAREAAARWAGTAPAARAAALLA